MNRILLLQTLLLLLALIFGAGVPVANGVQEEEGDIGRPPSVTKVWIEMLDEPPQQANVEEEIDILHEISPSGETGEKDHSTRNLQQFLPYCDGIKTEILCTNMKTNKDCATEIVPYNRNGCYLYLKYTIAITNKGSEVAKIAGLTRQLNGEERDFSGMISKTFVLKPRMRINISRTEYVDYCEAHKFIGTGAEVLANVGSELATRTCVEHDIYIVSGDVNM